MMVGGMSYDDRCSCFVRPEPDRATRLFDRRHQGREVVEDGLDLLVVAGEATLELFQLLEDIPVRKQHLAHTGEDLDDVDLPAGRQVLTAIACSLRSTLASMRMPRPCFAEGFAKPQSVKAKGRYLMFSPRFKVTIRDLEASASSRSSSNRKSSGKRSMFRRTACLSTLTCTP